MLRKTIHEPNPLSNRKIQGNLFLVVSKVREGLLLQLLKLKILLNIEKNYI